MTEYLTLEHHHEFMKYICAFTKKDIKKIRAFRIDKFYVFCLQLHFVCIIESIKLEKTFEVFKSSLA